MWQSDRPDHRIKFQRCTSCQLIRATGTEHAQYRGILIHPPKLPRPNTDPRCSDSNQCLFCSHELAIIASSQIVCLTPDCLIYAACPHAHFYANCESCISEWRVATANYELCTCGRVYPPGQRPAQCLGQFPRVEGGATCAQALPPQITDPNFICSFCTKGLIGRPTDPPVAQDFQPQAASKAPQPQAVRRDSQRPDARPAPSKGAGNVSQAPELPELKVHHLQPSYPVVSAARTDRPPRHPNAFQRSTKMNASSRDSGVWRPASVDTTTVEQARWPSAHSGGMSNTAYLQGGALTPNTAWSTASEPASSANYHQSYFMSNFSDGACPGCFSLGYFDLFRSWRRDVFLHSV